MLVMLTLQFCFRDKTAMSCYHLMNLSNNENLIVTIGLASNLNNAYSFSYVDLFLGWVNAVYCGNTVISHFINMGPIHHNVGTNVYLRQTDNALIQIVSSVYTSEFRWRLPHVT